MTARPARAGERTTTPRCCGPTGAGRRPPARRHLERPARQEVFAHIPGAEDVKTGIEPLFAWVRVSLGQAASKTNSPPKTHVLLQDLCTRHLGGHVWPVEYDVRVDALLAQVDPSTSQVGRVRRRCCWSRTETFVWPWPRQRVPESRCAPWIRLPCWRSSWTRNKPATWTCWFPSCPAHGRSSSRSGRWVTTGHLPRPTPTGVKCRPRPPRSTCPSKRLRGPSGRISRLAEVVAEKNPATGEYCSLTGTWVYADVWSTPNSMMYAMLLDPMGYHAQAERYLAIFKKRQGVTVPPGKAFSAPRLPRHAPRVSGGRLAYGQRGAALGASPSTHCCRETPSSSRSTRRPS